MNCFALNNQTLSVIGAKIAVVQSRVSLLQQRRYFYRRGRGRRKCPQVAAQLRQSSGQLHITLPRCSISLLFMSSSASYFTVSHAFPIKVLLPQFAWCSSFFHHVASEEAHVTCSVLHSSLLIPLQFHIAANFTEQ